MGGGGMSLMYVVAKKDKENEHRGTFVCAFSRKEDAEDWVEEQINPDLYCVASADMSTWKGWIGTP